jgi:hypothetical protein
VRLFPLNLLRVFADEIATTLSMKGLTHVGSSRRIYSKGGGSAGELHATKLIAAESNG